MTRKKLTNLIRRLLKLGFFEIFTVSLLLIYFYYVSFSFLVISKRVQPTTPRPPIPLFQIQKSDYFRATTDMAVARLRLVTSEPEVANVKCKVVVAIILCEDDRYLSVKNASMRNLTMPHGVSSSNAKPEPERSTVARDFSRQINQTLVLMKSIAILTKYDNASRSLSPCVEFLLLADNPKHYENIRKEIENNWSIEFQKLIKISHVPVRYPPGSAWMRKLFRPCATLRLFLAELLPSSVDSVIYLDTDIIFLQSVQELWQRFGRLDDDGKKRLSAMAPCLFHYGSKASEVPYYGTSGLNAGVMLMNLTRMRGSQWTNKIRMVTTMFKDKITLADQDILNIYFHFFPEELHLLTCDWNFRPFQCRDGSHCTDPELTQGISALHGNALSFTPQGPEPLFHVVFKTFHRTKLDDKFNLKAFSRQLETSLLKAEEKAYLSTSHCKRYGGLDVLILNRLYSLLDQQ